MRDRRKGMPPRICKSTVECTSETPLHELQALWVVYGKWEVVVALGALPTGGRRSYSICQILTDFRSEQIYSREVKFFKSVSLKIFLLRNTLSVEPHDPPCIVSKQNHIHVFTTLSFSKVHYCRWMIILMDKSFQSVLPIYKGLRIS